MADNQDLHLRTDLHTHLAAILPTETLISYAKNHGINESDIDKPLDIDRTTTFSNMTKVYQNRNKVIRRLIKDGYGTDFFKEIAREYQKYGIEYVEITTDSTILSKIASGEIDINSIEKEFGVSLRFLLQIHRDADAKSNIEAFFNKDMQKLMTNANFIKGVDICGQEDNSTEIANQKEFLQSLINYLKHQKVDMRKFVIRIHSGETTNDRSGISDTLMTIKDYCQIAGVQYPWIRFGHAFYGIDENVIKLMQQMAVSVDFNLASNLRLNNLNQVELLNDKDLKNAIKLCQQYDIPIFLGTDGFGLYHSTPDEQIELAKKVGIDINNVLKNENEYLDDFNDKSQEMRKRVAVSTKSFIKEKLANLFEAMRVVNISNQKNICFADKTPISILSGSTKSRSEMSVEEYTNAYTTFNTLLRVLDPKKVFFVTSGVSTGAERFLHDVIKNYNDPRPFEDNYCCLGVIPKFVGKENETFQFDFSKIVNSAITHGLIVDLNKQWGEYPSQYVQTVFGGDITTKNKGIAVFFGGGRTTKDVIHLCLNGDLSKTSDPVDSWLFTGSKENLASKEMFEAYKDKPCAHGFEDAETFIKSLYDYYNRPGSSPNQIFKDDFDINKLGEYVLEAKKDTPFIHRVIGDTMISEGLISKHDLNSYTTEMITSGEPNLYIINRCKERKDCSNLLRMYLEYANRFVSAFKANQIPEETFRKMTKRYDPSAANELKAVVDKKDIDRGLS